MKKRRPHPNRRLHALAPEGRAERFVLSLAPEDVERLATLAERWACSRAEVVRRLIRER